MVKEGIVVDNDQDLDRSESDVGGFVSGRAFPMLVALWFGALFGAGCLFLPPSLFDAVFGANPPLGANTRIVVALAAAGIGLLAGLLISVRVRSEDSQPAAPVAPRKSRKSRRKDARAPLDVRAALGLVPTENDRDVEGESLDAYELSDEHVADDHVPEIEKPDAVSASDHLKAPIDDPYFASAWSASGANDSELVDPEIAAPAACTCSVPAPAEPATHPREYSAYDASNTPSVEADEALSLAPLRYNPFSDLIPREEHALAPDARAFAEPESPRPHQPEPAPEAHGHPEAEWENVVRGKVDISQSVPASRPSAPPPPPAWPEPRGEEPNLMELGVAELVERLARALQNEDEDEDAPQFTAAPQRSGEHRHESALAPMSQPTFDVDHELRMALDRLSRLDNVA